MTEVPQPNASLPILKSSANDDCEKYKTTVRGIEHSTGYDFLNSVPKSVQEVIENR